MVDRGLANIFPMPFQTLLQLFIACFVCSGICEQNNIHACKCATLMPETFPGDTPNSVSANSKRNSLFGNSKSNSRDSEVIGSP